MSTADTPQPLLTQADLLFDALAAAPAGAGAALERLLLAAARDRLPHALLVQGPAGCGKRHLAVRLAQSLACTGATGGLFAPEPAEGTARACLSCASCERILRGHDPAVRLLEPPLDEKTGARRSEIPVEAVRRIQQGLTLRSDSPRRFIIIDPADRLSSVAQEALLKTLEEPPAGVVILLLSSRPSSLRPTVRSRCQVVRLAPPSPAALAAAVASSRGLGAEAAARVAAHARGHVRRAARLVPDETHEAWTAVARSLYEVLGSRGESRARDAALEVAARKGAKLDADAADEGPRDPVTAWLDDVEDVLARVVRCGVGLGVEHEEARRAVEALASRLAPARAARALDAVQSARSDLALHCSTKVSLSHLLLEIHALRDGGGPGLAEARLTPP